MRRPWLARADPPGSPLPPQVKTHAPGGLTAGQMKIDTVPLAAPLANLPRSTLPAGAIPMRVAAQ